MAEGAIRQRRRDGAAETGRQWIVTSADDLVPLSGGGRSVVYRRGDVVIRDAGPWTPAVHALLRHLEDAGFVAAQARQLSPRRPSSIAIHDDADVKFGRELGLKFG